MVLDRANPGNTVIIALPQAKICVSYIGDMEKANWDIALSSNLKVLFDGIPKTIERGVK